METTVAGVNFKNADGSSRTSIIERMSNNDEIYLERDPENKYDSNAVKVCVLMDGEKKQIGFLERRIAAEVSHRMLMGESFPVSIIRRGYYTNGRYRSIFCRIDIENVVYYEYLEDYRQYLSLYKKIDDLDIQSVFRDALKTIRIETVKDLAKCDKKEIYKLRVVKNCGIDEIEIALRSLRFNFGEPLEKLEEHYHLFIKGLNIVHEFVDEEYVYMYLANQSFQSSDGSLINVENNRMHIGGEHAGNISVLQCTHTNAVLALTNDDSDKKNKRKINVQFVGDKLQLVDPVDGKVYYHNVN